MYDLLPPQNVEAEAAILGGILLDPQALDRICSELEPNAFYIQGHQEIYKAALCLNREGQPTDLMTVTQWLNDRKLLDKIGGSGQLAQLVERTVSAANIDRYAALVQEKYLRRRLAEAGQQIVSLGFDTTQELDTCLDKSEQSIFNISNQRLGSCTESNRAIATSTYDDLAASSPIYPTGLLDLDELMVGFEPGTMTIVAGRPSMGKSAIALFLAMSLTLQHQLPVLFFSLEMTKQQLEYRLWSLISVLERYRSLKLIPLRSDRLRRHRAGHDPLSTAELNSIAQIAGIASELNLYINDDRGLNVAGIASECRQIKAKTGQLGLVVVDYLQLMAGNISGNRSYELGDVARGLYKLAADVEAPVLALSQISRAVEARQDKRPMMSDLSQSGILEMVADNIILAYRDEYYFPETPDQGILELILAKARHGSTGKAKVVFNGAYGKLSSLA